MVRTQIQLTERQSEALKKLATRRRVSVAEVIRGAVDEVISKNPAVDDDDMWQRALSVVGAFRSDRSDVSERHDDYLAEAYQS